MSTEGIKLAILTPSCRDPKWGYKNTLEAMMMRLQMAQGDDSRWWMGGKRIHSFEIGGNILASLLSQGRQRAYDAAIQNGMDYILWWDDDVAVEPEALPLLFAANVTSIACNVLCKGIAQHPEKYPDDGIWFSAIGLDRKPMSSLRATGIEECYNCGMAFHLVDLRAVRHIPRPHFEVRWDAEWNDYRGEDWFFTRKLAENGIKTYIHHDASRMCAHIGDWNYNIQNMAIFMKSQKAFIKLAEMMEAEKKGDKSNEKS
jgi:hypothetical protein